MGYGQLALFVGLFGALGLPNPAWAILLAGTVVCAASRCPVRRWRGMLYALALGIAATGIHGWLWLASQLPEDCWREPLTAKITVLDFPRLESVGHSHARQTIVARLEHISRAQCAVSGRLQLSLYETDTHLAIGDRLRVRMRLSPPSSQWSPGAIPDQARHAAARRVARGTVSVIQFLPAVHQPVVTLRKLIGHHLDAAGLDVTANGLLRALIIGDGSALSDTDWQWFRSLGIAHVLVISGLHVGLVAGFAAVVAGVPRRFGGSSGDRGGVVGHHIAVLLAALGYAALAGFTVPTQRALWMLVAVLLTRQLGWHTRPWRTLLIAVNSILLVQPHAALGSGFWMSAGATWALLHLANHSDGRQGILRAALWLQLRLMVYLLPMSWFWFGEASLLSALTNLSVVPVLTLWTVPLGLLGALLLPVSDTIAYTAWHAAVLPVPVLFAAMDRVLEQTAAWAVLSLSPSLETAVCAVAVLVIRRWHHRFLLVGGLILMLALRHGKAPAATELVVLDIGQGTSVLFHDAGRALLYDTGGGMPGRFLQVEKIVLPYLERYGIDRLDTLVVSHRDLDHSAGARRIADLLPIDRWLGHGGEPCRVGSAWQWRPGLRFSVLNGTGQGQHDSNAGSCVLLIEAEGHRILLAGDIPQHRERDLVRYWRGGLSADLLLVSHHGSHTSTGYSWLKWVDPETAILSNGRGNRFGHPADAVVARLRWHGIEVVSTADAGTLRWTFTRRGRVLSGMRGPWTPYWLRLDGLGYQQSAGYTRGWRTGE